MMTITDPKILYRETFLFRCSAMQCTLEDQIPKKFKGSYCGGDRRRRYSDGGIFDESIEYYRF